MNKMVMVLNKTNIMCVYFCDNFINKIIIVKDGEKTSFEQCRLFDNFLKIKLLLIRAVAMVCYSCLAK